MLRTNFMLVFLVFCYVTPWIVGELVNNENSTVEATTNGTYNDDTRREDQQLYLNDLNTASQTTIENKNEETNLTESLSSRLLAVPTEISEDSEVPCDNAQFLLKILTVMLPILKNELPANVRTSYILLILKDLLKSSPEAAQDYEIMYKINELLETLERFHGNDQYALDNNNNALRTRDTPEPFQNGVRSKVVFKYEVPHLANPDCTAELLTIIKTVQHAIMRLVNNPICKTHIPVETSILMNVNKYLANPNLYSYDNEKLIENLPLLPDAEQKYNYFDKDIPENTGSHDKPNHYDKSPFNQKQKNPLLPKRPINEPIYIHPKNPIDHPIDFSYPIDISPDILSIINGDRNDNEYDSLNPKKPNPSVYEIERPYSDMPSYLDALPNLKDELNVQMPITPLEVTNDVKQARPYKKVYGYLPKIDQSPMRPSKQPPKHITPFEEIVSDRDYTIDYPNTSPLPFDVYGDGSGEVEIDKNRPYPALDLDLPSNQQDIPKYRPSLGHPKIYKYDLQSPSSHSPLDIYEDDDSAKIPIGIQNPDQPIEKPNPSLFDVDGSTESAYIPLHPKPYNPDLYVMYPDQNPEENPNEYNTGDQNLPTDRGVPVLPNNRQKPHYIPYLPQDSSNEVPNNPYNSYLPNDDYEPSIKPLIPLDVSGDGSGEIQLGSTESPLSDYIDLYVPKKPKSKAKYPYDYLKPSYVPHKKENPKFKPETFLVDDTDSDRDDAGLVIPNPIDLYAPDQDSIVISEPITKRPSRPEVENLYAIPKILDFEDLSSDSEPNYITHINEPNADNPNNIPNLPRPILVPDNKILHIINDNIDLVQQKIPSKHLNEEILDMIRRLQDLLNKSQITIEEYVNIINQYQILVEYVKHLDISNAIMKELLLSMTNLDKLDLQTGKSPVIELTYLIKRPKPLIYQPYYYIKYQLPYNSFLTRVHTLLALKPNLKNNPAKLYKALISMSKISETSPDLDKYDTDDIFKLTFHKGTLVGAKLMKGVDLDMFNTLDKLKNINSDYSIEDVYGLIRNLDAQLKHKNEGLVLENSNIPTFNIQTHPTEVQIVKVKKQPMLQEITKIMSNKVGADHISADILNKVNYLRTNESANHTEEETNPLENDTDKTNKSASIIARTRYIYNLNQYNTGVPLNGYERINYNTNTDPKPYLTDDYVKDSKNLNYYNKNNADKYYGFNTKNSALDLDFNKQYSHPTEYDKRPGSNQGKWLDETINSFNKKPKSQNYKSIDIDYFHNKPSNDPYLADNDSASLKVNSEIYQNQQLHSINLLDSLKDNINHKQDDNTPQKYYFDSGPASVSKNENINNPYNVKSHLVTHSKTYINGIPVKHTKSYRIEKPYNEVQEFETSYSHPKKYNIEHSQYLTDYNQNIANTKSSQYQDINLGKGSLISDGDSTKYITETESGIYTNSNNKFDSTNKLTPAQDLSSLNQYQSYNTDTTYQIAQNPAHTNINQYNNQYSDSKNYNTGSSVGNYGIYNQNFVPNYVMNPGYRYIIRQNWPLFHQLNRPRVRTHPLLG